jgi:hypothetical protein
MFSGLRETVEYYGISLSMTDVKMIPYLDVYEVSARYKAQPEMPEKILTV